MRDAHNIRHLSGNEILMAFNVFRGSLPPWDRIYITDGLGPVSGVDNPYTERLVGVGYYIHLGPEVYPDATLATKNYKGYGLYKNILIHEMTHVWQYFHGYSVATSSFWAVTLGDGYNYVPGDLQDWDDYNVEQQAHIVEDWFADHFGDGYKYDMKELETDDVRFYYIKHHIRGEVMDHDWIYTSHVRPIQLLPTGTLHVEIQVSFEYLVPILQKRFQPSDEQGFLGRVKQLVEIFSKLEPVVARDLRVRLEARRPGDLVAHYFYANLSPLTTNRLMGILKDRYRKTGFLMP